MKKWFAGIREKKGQAGNVWKYMAKVWEWGRRRSFPLALLLACALVAGSLVYRAHSTAGRASGQQAMAAVPSGIWNALPEGEERPRAVNGGFGDSAEVWGALPEGEGEPGAADTDAGDPAWRMTAPLEVFEVVGGYSPRTPVWRPSLREYAAHPALDLAAPLGSEARAPAEGTVTAVYRDPELGWAVEMACGDEASSSLSGEALTVLCAGLAASPLPREGQRVRSGEVIGSVGEAPGEADLPPHIHLEIKQGGRSIDPAALLP